MVPFKRNDEEESFEDLFSRVIQNFHPNQVRRQFKNDRSKNGMLWRFYEEVYMPNRFFLI